MKLNRDTAAVGVLILLVGLAVGYFIGYDVGYEKAVKVLLNTGS